MIIFSLFFQNEKVADTKSRLQQLMINTPQTQDKSLLIQTVALFEALLGKIHQLQEENDTLKTTLESNKEVEELSKERDQIIFELEATRNKLEDSNKVLLVHIKTFPFSKCLFFYFKLDHCVCIKSLMT